MDLMSGLDTDDLTLEAAPISGQDIASITVSPNLQPGAQPTQQITPTTLLPTTLLPAPTPQVEQPV